jgi:formylglycine-generating enzyme required for sulfatase activity/serine/threonine protein kinase
MAPPEPRPKSPHPDEPASLGERLERRFGAGIDPEVSLDAAPGETTSATSDLVRRLGKHRQKAARYELEGEVARGGMGAILRVWDGDLRRHLAMKVILGRESGEIDATPRIEPGQLGRFLEEAQVTSQLDHPGIVPVHELGLDAEGRVYFTMKLVKGRDLKTIFDLVFRHEEGWNETRALGVLLKACEAMAYAHAKGVIHRDLKPANVMVGNFGEVYVMDWGLARVLGRRDRHDIRIAAELLTSMTSVKTERREDREEWTDSPILTMDGDVVGTPAYMPPEQARGEIEKLGGASDVYALGAMLYHLLAQQPPYIPRGARLSNRTVLGLVVQGPPAALSSLRPDVPAELVAIVEKAMARDPFQRYADTLALAEDLRAFLENRVVGAYETGAWAEARKWLKRNKPLAASLGGGVVLLAAGLTTSLVFAARARDQERIAMRKANDVLSLSAIQELKELSDRADALWPAEPAQLAACEAWLEDARSLVAGRAADGARGAEAHPGLADHEAKLDEIRRRARGSAGAGSGGAYVFADAQDRWWHAQLSQLVADLKTFTDEKAGGLFSSGTSPEHGWGVVRRAELARTLEERSVSGVEARRGWDEAIAAIARHPLYGGLALTPQLGLLPIGADPESGLWEFAHLASGDPARRGADGRLVLTEETGLVLVLIPGGTFAMGAQSTDEDGANHDAQAKPDEAPVHDVTLSPYCLSKYEMTQGQWQRFVGRNPSQHGPEMRIAGHQHSRLHPVEQVSWSQCMEVLPRLGLALPTEAQWENACRAGTTTPWSSGAERESLRGAVNLADQTAAGAKLSWQDIKDWPDLEDGWALHAAVGSLRANPYGLHDMHGNVWEWCQDGYDASAYAKSVPADPVAPWAGASFRVLRGGSFSLGATNARSSVRHNNTAEFQHNSLGLRPACMLRR